VQRNKAQARHLVKHLINTQMPTAQKKTIIASSSGNDEHGKPIINPESVLTYVDEESRTYQSLAIDAVRFTFNAIWEHSIKGVNLHTQLVYDFVPFHPAVVRDWLKKELTQPNPVMFPRSHLDTASKDPCIHIQKNIANPAVQIGAASMNANLTLHVFHRKIESASPDLQPFDAEVWHHETYGKWVYMHQEFAPMLEDECRAKNSAIYPQNACKLFRCMMNAHFNDCGYIFGKLWFGFGYKDMVAKPDRFMQEMLFEMFMNYHKTTNSVLGTLPPLFAATTLGSGQRICAKCLTSRLGSGQMKRCKCHSVYYCSKACQKSDWKVHRVMCKYTAE
jgi:hypothetical protein